MDVHTLNFDKRQKTSTTITSALVSAVLEWLLICMIFIHSIYSYLVTKFARYSHLQIPCLLCSRLDQFLGNDSVCRNGKYTSKSYADKMFQTKSIDSEVAEVDSSLPVTSKCDRDMEIPEKDSVSLLHLESENNTFSVVESEATLHHGLEEIKWDQADQSDSINVSSELISFDDTLPPSKINETHYDLKETIVTSTSNLEKELNTNSTEAPTLETDSKEIQSNPISETKRVENDSIFETDIYMDSKPSNKTGTNSPLDLGDAYKLALGTRGRQLSGRFLEQQRSITESSRACEDLKLLLSQISANYDMSPRLSANHDDYKSMESFGSINMQILQRRISLERNESNLSLDGSIVSEVEGESLVDRLKRQVEHDKMIISGLYKELEEERNASSVAANQAMAMITRLQEEKSSLHMEALQFLRMMEEQAEYDGEALQNANDLLVEKDKQIQELESELELHRNQLGTESLSAKVSAEKLDASYGETILTA